MPHLHGGATSLSQPHSCFQLAVISILALPIVIREHIDFGIPLLYLFHSEFCTMSSFPHPRVSYHCHQRAGWLEIEILYKIFFFLFLHKACSTVSCYVHISSSHYHQRAGWWWKSSIVPLSQRALSVIAGRTIGLSREHRLFNPNSPSRMQNDATPMSHLLAGDIGSNEYWYL